MNDDAKKAGLLYAPPLLLEASGLKEYNETIQSLAWIDCDNNGLPTFKSLSYFDVEGPFNTMEFLEIYGRWLSDERLNAIKKRKK